MKRTTKENLTNLGASMGVILLIIGAAGMDSESLMLPVILIIVGLLLISLTAKEAAKWEDYI